MNWKHAIFHAVLIIAIIPSHGVDAQERPVWTYRCEGNVCDRTLLGNVGEPQSLNVCKLTCDSNAMLWPRPSGIIALGKTIVSIDAQQVTVASVGLVGRAKELLDKATVRFQSQFTSLAAQIGRLSEKASSSLHVDVTILNPGVVRVELDTDESYTLNVMQNTTGRVDARITAETYFGARHALETVVQLAVSDEVSSSLVMLADATVTDRPAFTHRGLNLDTARNYFSVESIKRTLDAMAVNKLNTFHWHMTDSHSWPFVSDSFPQLSQYGAYSPKQVYTPADIRDIVEYGTVRGLRVLPELDAPAHVGEGFQWADAGAVVCYKAQPWADYCLEPPCGQFNPTHDQVYDILGGVYGDMMQVFDSDVFHMGGDEVNLNCWNSSLEVTDEMAVLGLPRTTEGFLQLWQAFQTRAYNKLVEANGGKRLPAILWNSGLTELGEVDKYIDKETYIIQIWSTGDDPIIADLVNKGFRVIFTNYDALYLDCGYGGWVSGGNNWCSPYIGWEKVYNNDPYQLLVALNVTLDEAKRLVLGSEASLWTEQTDESTLDSKLWPRLAALAERLWSNPKEGWRAAEARMLNHRERLRASGLNPNMLQPEWCHQNQGYCPISIDAQLALG